MKLLTHNLLKSNVKKAKTGYPLIIDPVTVEVRECEFNPEFILSMLDRLEWKAFHDAYFSLTKGESQQLPKSRPSSEATDEDFLKLVHHALLEVVLVEGFLICPDTGRKFKVDFGIPNMLLNEDEL